MSSIVQSFFLLSFAQEESIATLSDLTDREIEILRLVLAGLTNRAIAVVMCISEKTVEFHLGRIYNKIGMRTRTLAGIWAIQNGLRSKIKDSGGRAAIS